MIKHARIRRPIAVVAALVVIGALVVAGAGPAGATVVFVPQSDLVSVGGLAITPVDVDVSASSGALSFGSSTLPPGLTIAAGTGVIAGTPTSIGTYAVTVIANDNDGPVALNFTWTIRAVRVGAGKFGVGQFGLGHSSHEATRAFLEDPANFGPGGILGVGGLEVIPSVQTITQAYLDGIDILFDGWVWEGVGVDTYSSGELASIHSWVAAGGLLIINDDEGNQLPPPEGVGSHISSADALANRFGEDIDGSIIAHDQTPPQSDPLGEPVSGQAGHAFFTGPFGAVATIEGDGTTGHFTPPLTGGFIALMEDASPANANILVAEKVVGDGYVVLTSDEGFFRHFETADNQAFTGNVFAHLISRITNSGTPGPNPGPATGPGVVAVGVPGEDIGNLADAGVVDVVPTALDGSPLTGLTFELRQGSGVLGGKSEAGDRFGAVVLTADIDGNGFDDLVISSPNEAIGARKNAGMVQVVYMDADGADRSDQFHQGTAGVVGKPEAGDQFGFATATMDWNGDGHLDLIVGVPFENVGSTVDAGGFNVLFGSPNGIVATGSRWVDQNSAGIDDTVEAGDRFGYAMDGDRRLLAVGAPNEALSGNADAGLVQVIDPVDGNWSFAQGTGFDESANEPGVGGALEPGDLFGSSIAVAGSAIAAGAPGENWQRIDAGSVNIVDNRTRRGTIVGQPVAGITGKAEISDEFGATLAGFRADGQTPVFLIGVPSEDRGKRKDSGLVHAVAFDAATLSVSELAAVHQSAPGVPGKDEAGDQFGASLEIDVFGNYIIGSPGEAVGRVIGAGAVTYLGTHGALFHQGTPGVPGKVEAGDAFGSA